MRYTFYFISLELFSKKQATVKEKVRLLPFSDQLYSPFSTMWLMLINIKNMV